MSYDLYLKPRSGVLSQDRFRRYFQTHAQYTVQGQQAWYQNEDTGVYFSFELHRPQAAAEDDDPGASYSASFNMNFFRPSFFVLEAERELSRVIGEFDFVVFDPQTDGMGEGEFSPSRLISGWSKANEFAYSAILGDPANRTGVASMPTDKLQRIWRWSHERRALQQELGESVFVPQIMFFKEDAAVVSVVVWSDGIPTAFPTHLDAVIVYLKELAPRVLFRRKETTSRVGWVAVRPLVERFSRSTDNALISEYSTPPKDVIEYLQRLPSRTQTLVAVSADSVLDAELVARYTA